MIIVDECHMLSMFPANAGMNRLKKLSVVIERYVPRERGDEPELMKLPSQKAAMFPANAGMNRVSITASLWL